MNINQPLPEQLAFLQENHFDHTHTHTWQQIPLADEPFGSSWAGYIKEIEQQSLMDVLPNKLVQLNFPVQEGMSQNPHYQAATRRGADPSDMTEATGVRLRQPEQIKIHLHQTMAGKIPVLQVQNRFDFETLVQVLAHKNEPVPAPPSMGACMVKNYNNWDRIKSYRQKWQIENNIGENQDLWWQYGFATMQADPGLYKDTLIIISDNPYSNVPAEMLGLSHDQWRRLSLLIRREHEATHYCTLRFWGSARNHLLDEVIADYMGIVAATGSFNAHWLLTFLGLENYPDYRPGGRLTNYLKGIELSGDDFNQLCCYIYLAANNLETISTRYAPDIYQGMGKYKMLLAMSRLNLVQMAATEQLDKTVQHMP